MRIRKAFWIAVVWCCLATTGHATQIVSLDFDTYTITTGPDPERVYSEEERMTIKEILEGIYMSDPGDPFGGPFAIKFDIVDPASPPPPFTTSLVKFNSGAPGGSAEKIDFRNLDDDDDVSVNAVGLLEAFEGAEKSEALGGGTWTLEELTSGPSVVMASANLAAHELGHIMGLRHHDSFGPISAGIGVAATKYTPTYPGPTLSTLAELHVLGLSSSVALNANSLVTDSWLAERSAVKMSINAAEDAIGPNPYVTDESEFGGDASDSGFEASPISLLPIGVPNTTRPPEPYAPGPGGGPEMFEAFAVVVTAELEPRDPETETFDEDWYTFIGEEGAIMTVEVISHVMRSTEGGRIDDWIDSTVELLDDKLFPLAYGGPGGFSINDDQFESSDSILFDVVLPYTGEYFIEVTPKATDVVGKYELLVYAAHPIVLPEPCDPGDADRDGDVDDDDLSLLLANWGSDDVTCDEGEFSGEPPVDDDDLSLLLANWTGPLGDSVPDPATLSLLAMGGPALMTLLRRRNRRQAKA